MVHNPRHVSPVIIISILKLYLNEKAFLLKNRNAFLHSPLLVQCAILLSA